MNKIELLCDTTSPDKRLLVYTGEKKQVLLKIESQIDKGSFPYQDSNRPLWSHDLHDIRKVIVKNEL